jgi:hypothetical protein
MMRIKLLLLLTIFIVFVPTVMAGDVMRSFEPDVARPGGTVIISLLVQKDEGTTQLAISEIFPEGFTLTDNAFENLDGADFLVDEENPNEMALLKEGARSIANQYKYELRVPDDAEGEVEFLGDYGFTVDGEEVSGAIGGSSILHVVEEIQQCPEGTYFLNPAERADPEESCEDVEILDGAGLEVSNVAHTAVYRIHQIMTGPDAVFDKVARVASALSCHEGNRNHCDAELLAGNEGDVCPPANARDNNDVCRQYLPRGQAGIWIDLYLDLARNQILDALLPIKELFA